jgi:hypothetical protein
MMAVSKFRVLGKLDSAGRTTAGTVSIDRATGMIEVRPLRRRRTYTMLLSDVATLVCQRVIQHEVAKTRKEKAEARRLRKKA